MVAAVKVSASSKALVVERGLTNSIIEGKFTHSGLQECTIDGRLLAESTLFPSSGEAMLSGTLYHRGDLAAAVLV